MSVMIKGMKMPKSCSECPLDYDEMRCNALNKNYEDEDYLKKRLPDCPLINLPEVRITDDLQKL